MHLEIIYIIVTDSDKGLVKNWYTLAEDYEFNGLIPRVGEQMLLLPNPHGLLYRENLGVGAFNITNVAYCYFQQHVTCGNPQIKTQWVRVAVLPIDKKAEHIIERFSWERAQEIDNLKKWE